MAKVKTKKQVQNEGEISCFASTNGRRITLDPIRQVEVTFKLDEVESTIPCGFRVDWASGDKDGKKFELLCGAGCGSPYLILHYDEKQYCVHARTLMDAIFDKLDKE